MRPVRQMKKYSHIQVANILGAIGYYWKSPKHRPHSIEKMVEGLPLPVLELIVEKLKRYDAESCGISTSRTPRANPHGC